ncbi:hypothetical protein ACTFIW_001888 [Dictyostelium discoideum]
MKNNKSKIDHIEAAINENINNKKNNSSSGSSSINTNNDVSYDTKCNIHSDQEIELICTDCKVPICKFCMVSSGKHVRHTFDLINLENSKKLFIEFKSKNIKNLQQCLDADKEIQKKSDEIFSKIDLQHASDLESIKMGFKELHKVLSAVETDITRQLLTKFDENQDVSTNIKQLIEDNKKSIDSIVNKHKDSIDTYQIEQIVNNNKQLNIELLKYGHKSQLLFNNLKDNENEKQLFEYKKTNIKRSIDSTKQSITNSFKINSDQFYNTEPDTFELRGVKFQIYRDGAKNVKLNGSVAFDNKIFINFNTFHSLTTVCLMDGFDQTLNANTLPTSITDLYIGDIKSNLVVGSIPKSVTSLFLMDGFSKSIESGIIPDSVENLYLGKIKSKLSNASIPLSTNQYNYYGASVGNKKSLYLMDGFDQNLTSQIFSNCKLETIYCGDTDVIIQRDIAVSHSGYNTPVIYNQKYKHTNKHRLKENREWGNSSLKITCIKNVINYNDDRNNDR